ncbi:PTS sugar transporter subunit IIB [Streptomyces roseicoloratus]|uniref:PTS sugar transporter subunit IIB n=1 Tax=Streptomyces roseicoloratus TaxID=2508722 RepID=UPI001009F87A|nr:PTS sugar transporter subunit IIB [Streptomyces roseicoloratus]
MKILTVCGMGVGSSIILKMNVEKALRSLGVTADVEVADIGTARGAAAGADLVVTSGELAPQLGELKAKIVVIDNLVNVDLIARALEAALSEAR